MDESLRMDMLNELAVLVTDEDHIYPNQQARLLRLEANIHQQRDWFKIL